MWLICIDELASAPDREDLDRIFHIPEDAIGLEDEFARVVCVHVTGGLAAERESRELCVDMAEEPLDPIACGGGAVVSDVAGNLDHAVDGAR